jgi:hypothetical protein
LGRGGFEIPPQFQGDVAPVTLPELSSSAVRAGLADGSLPQGWLVREVESEIRRAGLYVSAGTV